MIFAPVAHELMLKLQRMSEMKRQPKFISDKNGLVVLEVGNDSRLREFNIGVNSKIISVNDEYIECEKDIYTILKKNLHKAVIKIKDCDGVIKDIDYVHDNNRLGVLLVPLPKEENHNYNKETVSKSFKDVLMDVNGDKTHKE